MCVHTRVLGCVSVFMNMLVWSKEHSRKLPEAAIGDDCSKDGREVAEHNEGVVQGCGCVLLVREEANQVQCQHS